MSETEESLQSVSLDVAGENIANLEEQFLKFQDVDLLRALACKESIYMLKQQCYGFSDQRVVDCCEQLILLVSSVKL